MLESSVVCCVRTYVSSASDLTPMGMRDQVSEAQRSQMISLLPSMSLFDILCCQFRLKTDCDCGIRQLLNVQEAQVTRSHLVKDETRKVEQGTTSKRWMGRMLRRLACLMVYLPSGKTDKQRQSCCSNEKSSIINQLCDVEFLLFQFQKLDSLATMKAINVSVGTVVNKTFHSEILRHEGC